MLDTRKHQQPDREISMKSDYDITKILEDAIHYKTQTLNQNQLAGLSIHNEGQRLGMSHAKSILTKHIMSVIDEHSIYFQNQTQIDSVFKDISSMVGGCMKANVVACEKEGMVIGNLSFNYDEDLIECTKNSIEVENDAVCMSLAKDYKFYKDRFDCIIVKAGKGQSDLATRLFVRKINIKLDVPVFALVDSDCDGLKVLLDYGITTPNLKWLGIRPSDLDKYEIPEEFRLPMTEEDIKAGEDLLKEDFVKKNAAWVKELNLMMKLNQKVELQALSTIDFDYLTKLYVPMKLQKKDWLKA
ncbi:DNA topoisomerase 6 subunit A [Artemisia annua]|uniref:DNA topoisomerase 6 subunit A n=1 Tax=Artemisia annua TaxID=35608 RepID=A0A2U1P9S3_ARTAN|nr:DNA topoisomerase 6 subunit A [Artemisia annua]